MKTPKLYFYDTGLVSHLLGIKDISQINSHPLWGSLFENLVVSEIMKIKYHQNLPVDFFFWRDNSGHEIDIIINSFDQLLPIEIKAGHTVTSDYFKNIRFFQQVSGSSGGAVLYAGDQKQVRSHGPHVYPWTDIQEVLQLV